MPRRIDVGHDMNRPASRPRLVGGATGIFGQRVETAADTGIGAEQRDRAKLPLGFVDDVENILFLADIALEGRAVDRGSDHAGIVGIDIGDHHPACARPVQGFA